MPSRGSIGNSLTPDRPANLLPADYGLTAWTFPPQAVGSGTALTPAGTVFVSKIWIPAGTITNLHIFISVAGSGLTSGQCFAGLFDSSKQLLSATASQHTAWAGTDNKTMALSASQTSTGAFFYAGLFYNGTTGPTIARQANFASTMQNFGLGASSSVSATADTGRTTTFPSTLGAFTASALQHWIGVS